MVNPGRDSPIAKQCGTLLTLVFKRAAVMVASGRRQNLTLKTAKGQSMLINESDGHPDEALMPFLVLLEHDLITRPAEAARQLTDTLVRRLEVLSAEIGQLDPATPITDEVNV